LNPRCGVARSIALSLLAAVVLALGSAPGRAEVDLSGLPLNAEQARTLSERGFVVVEGKGSDLTGAYDLLRAEGTPTFISVDSIFYLTGLLLDQTLVVVEDTYLYDRLVELSREMVRLSEEQYLSAADPIVREDARHNLAFFSVGLSLLDPDYFPSEFGRGLVERELDLIEEARITAHSPIMGPTPLDGVLGPGEDYTLYVPAGRYTTTERLRRFYRAMTWYGRMAFALPEGRVEDYGLTRQALLIVRALEGEAGEWFELWERIHDPTAFYLGGSGDPTVREYMEIADEVFGEEFDIELLADEELIMEFAQRVAEIAPAHFESHELRGMRFLGRRYLPDTRIFWRLASSKERPVPSTLDLMALLGSRTARDEIEEAFGNDAYRIGFKEIELEFDEMTYGDWTRDLFWSALYAISALYDAPRQGAPAFTGDPAWDAKVLSTGAAAWVGLRYQASCASVSGTLATLDAAWEEDRAPLVEPYPHVYARLRELVENLRDRLWEHYLIDDAIDADLSRYAMFLTSLERLAGRTVSERALPAAGDASDYRAAIRRFRDPASRRLSIEDGLDEGSPACSALAYSDITSGRLLEVAVGYPDIIYVVADVGEGPAVHAGAVFSFFEFDRGGERELAGKKWLSALGRAIPDRPLWVDRFLEP
jgi:hypothetical protein